ncbi:TRAPP 20 K subunit [Phaffia rhodozyma]|uniref:TRAPP 20 K subunit n=1 Tax=Phaffia rhodozyma TaxID=264483 RepID=A0A0F7SFT2_PHARH|nr:TRAPP 20 K subunit [Phaffia rhodozyma]
MASYLVLVGPLDNPLSEHTFPSNRSSPLPTSSTNSSTSSLPSSSAFPSWSSQASTVSPITSPFGANAASLAGVKELGRKMGTGQGGYDDGHLRQMVAHSSLDLIENAMGGGSMYYKNIDRYNEWTVSAFVAPNIKFILLHEQKNDEGIRLFFLEVWEAYVKIVLNPFHTSNTTIDNPVFDGKHALVPTTSYKLILDLLSGY